MVYLLLVFLLSQHLQEAKTPHFAFFIDALRKADFLRFHFSFLLGKSPNLKEKSELYGSQSALLHSLYDRLTPHSFSRFRLSR